jgi:hypothetical protein
MVYTLAAYKQYIKTVLFKATLEQRINIFRPGICEDTSLKDTSFFYD